MRVARRSFSVLMASLVAWFGVAAAAPLHAHAMDASQSLLLHMIAEDAHDIHGVDAHGHDHAEADAAHDDSASGGGTPSGGEPGEPVLHAHGCSHAATVNEELHVSSVGPTTAAIWFEIGSALNSVSSSPPRKPPRTIL
ncbi:MAG: hypothetical protein Q8R02_02955 [Hyphomonadaceae bacterium]|nr:hypothetical protein [Hyphomonadaceae bacterium]